MPSPEIPIIIPLILTGVMVGNLLRKGKPNMGWRFLIIGSITGGLGNLAHATLLYSMQGREVNPPVVQQYMAIQATSGPTHLLVGSFIVGTVTVMLVFAVAYLTVKIRGRETYEGEQ
ncbi:MAG: hypothetical protein ACUVTM_00195 [Candidatus Bathyarchaeia archaeon]